MPFDLRLLGFRKRAKSEVLYILVIILGSLLFLLDDPSSIQLYYLQTCG